MKTIGKFMQSGVTFVVKVNKTNSPSNYNLFLQVFKEGDKMAQTGRVFKDTDTKQDMMKWASKSLGAPESEEFKKAILGDVPTPPKEYVPLSKRWPEVYKIAQSIQRDTRQRINAITKENNPQIKKELEGWPEYWRQGLLELVIAELQKCV
jgi:hypothetical protein